MDDIIRYSLTEEEQEQFNTINEQLSDQPMPVVAPLKDNWVPVKGVVESKDETDTYELPDFTDEQRKAVDDLAYKYGITLGTSTPYENEVIRLKTKQQEEIGQKILNNIPPRFGWDTYQQVSAAQDSITSTVNTPGFFEYANAYGATADLFKQYDIPLWMAKSPEVKKALNDAQMRKEIIQKLNSDDVPESMRSFFADPKNIAVFFDNIDSLIDLKKQWDALALSLAPQRFGNLRDWFWTALANYAQGEASRNRYEAAVAEWKNRQTGWDSPFKEWSRQKDKDDAQWWQDIADWASPEAYLTPVTGYARFAHDMITSSGFTIASMVKSAAIYAAITATGGAAGVPAVIAKTAAVGAASLEGAWNESGVEAGQVYEEAINRGWSQDKAIAAANDTRAANMALLIGPELLQNTLAFVTGPTAKWYRASRRFLPNYSGLVRLAGHGAVRFGLGSLSEGFEEYMQETITAHALGDEVNESERLYSALIGTVSGAVFQGGGLGVRTLANRYIARNASDAKQNEEQNRRDQTKKVIDAITTVLSGKPVPRKLEEFIEQTGEGGKSSVYVDAQALINAYASENISDLDAIADDLQLTDDQRSQLKEAANTGGDVEMSAASLVTKASQRPQFYDAVRGDMKFDPDTLTENELAAVDKEELKKTETLMREAIEKMRAESAAISKMHSRIVDAFKQAFWPEGVTVDGDMEQYFDAVAQLFAMRKIREAQARGLNVEEAVNNGNIEVVNDGKTVKVVLRHNAQAQTQTVADTQQTTEAAPTAENAETQTTEDSATVQTETAPTAETTETKPKADTSAKEAQIARWKTELEAALAEGDKKAIKSLRRKIKRAEAALGKQQTELNQDGLVLAEFEQDFRHITMSRFRKFSNEYMGSGEGAQAFGWGTYLMLGDERADGIAKHYLSVFTNKAQRYANAEVVIDGKKENVQYGNASIISVYETRDDAYKISMGKKFAIQSILSKKGKKFETKKKSFIKQWTNWKNHFQKEVDKFSAMSVKTFDDALKVWIALNTHIKTKEAALQDLNYEVRDTSEEGIIRYVSLSLQVHIDERSARRSDAQMLVDIAESITDISLPTTDDNMVFDLRVDGPENDMLLHWGMPIDLNDERIVYIRNYVYDQIARLVEDGEARRAAKIANRIKDIALFDKGTDTTGVDLYYFLSEYSKALQLDQFDEERYIGKGDKQDRLASLFLNYVGYDGHIFWAMNGTGKHTNVYNAVIYDPENTLTITHRNGVPEVQEFEQSARGKTTFTSEETIISVFEGGDKSTMLHELGHVFLQELAQFARLDNADPEFVEEWQAISEWLGVSDIDPANITTQEDMKRWKNAQEQFAATFEAYLAEGVAPTPELQSIFRRFKQWLMDIYKAVSNIMWKDADGNLHRVEINDEIRGFYDRLFASREAIEQREAMNRVQERAEALREALRQRGASEEIIESIDEERAERLEAAGERLTAEIMSNEMELEQANIEDIADELLPGIREELENEPVYSAISSMQTNEELRLNRAELESYYGDDVDRLPDGIVSDTLGVSISTAAESFGFRSSDELFNALISTPPIDQAARQMALAEARKQAGHVTDENVDEYANEALFATQDAAFEALVESESLLNNDITDDITAVDDMAADIFHGERDIDAEELKGYEELADAYKNYEDSAIEELNETSEDSYWLEFGKIFKLNYWDIWAEFGVQYADKVWDSISQALPKQKDRAQYITKPKMSAAAKEQLKAVGVDFSNAYNEAMLQTQQIGEGQRLTPSRQDIESAIDSVVQALTDNATRSRSAKSQEGTIYRRAQEIRQDTRKMLDETGDKSSPEYIIAKRLAESESAIARTVANNRKILEANRQAQKKVDNITKDNIELKVETSNRIKDMQRDVATAESRVAERYKNLDKLNDRLREREKVLKDALELAEKNAKKQDKRSARREAVIKELRKEREALKRKIKKFEDIASDLEVREAIRKEKRDYIERKRRERNFAKEQRELLAGLRDAMRDEAVRKLRGKSIADATKVGWYAQQAEKFARHAEAALRNGDFEYAAQAKQWQAMNHLLAAEAANNRRTLARAKSFAAKLNREINKTGSLRGIAPNYGNQIKALLRRFSFVNAPAAQIEDATSLVSFIQELREAGEVVVIPDWVAEMTSSVPISSLTMSQLIDVHEALRSLAHLGRVSDKLIAANSSIKVGEVAHRLAEGLYSYYNKDKSELLDPNIEDNKKVIDRIMASGIAGDFMASLELAEFICRAIDGYKDMGEAHQIIFQPIRDAISREVDELNRVHKKVDDLIKSIYGSKLKPNFNGKKVEFDNVKQRKFNKETGEVTILEDKNLTLSRGAVIAAALNMGNDGNKQRMMDGWKFTEDDLRNILDSLSKEDMDFVQGIWDIFETELWPIVSSTHLLMTGYQLRKVEPTALETRHGVYRGGYYPIKVDMRYSEAARRQNEKQQISVGAIMSQQFEYLKPQTKDSHRKARAQEVNNWPPLLDIRVIDAHIGQSIHDGVMAPVVRDVHKIISNPEFKQAISDTIGSNRNLALNHWLRAVAQDNKNDGKYMNAIDRLMMKSRTGMIMMGLGANIAGGIMQTFGIFPLMSKVGVVRGVKALFRSILNWSSSRKFVTEHSAFMREQLIGTDRDVRKIAEQWSTTRNSPLTVVQSALLSHYAFFQNLCNVGGWIEAYQQGLQRYGTENEAVKYADMVVRTTQSAGSIADLTQMETSGTLGRLFTMFYSWFRVMLNMNIETWRRVRNEAGVGHKAAVFATHALFVLILPRMAEQILKGARPDDDEGWIKFLVTEGAKSVPLAVAESIPFVRDVTAYAMGEGNSSYRFTPIQAPFESVAKLLKRIGKESEKEFDDIDWVKVVNDSLDTFGYLGGVPVRGSKLIISDIYDALTGDQDWLTAMYRMVSNDRKRKK